MKMEVKVQVEMEMEPGKVKQSLAKSGEVWQSGVEGSRDETQCFRVQCVASKRMG